MSTKAVGQSGVCRRLLGVDPSPAMVRSATHHVSGVSFIVGTAEALPIGSRMVKVITAAGSLNYADSYQFFAEAQRVLSTDGLLIVYDFGAGRRASECPDLDQWFTQMLHRWPTPREGVQEVDRTTFESAPMHLVVYESLVIATSFELDNYIDYIMTESNVAAAVDSGIPASEIRAWCEAGLRPFFQGSLRIEFDTYYACLSQPR
jgi:SAM-dependent methyltransferase